MAKTYKEVTTNGKETGRLYTPITHYLKISTATCTKKSRYADYCHFEDFSGYGDYFYFMWKRKKIALDECERMCYPVFVSDENGKIVILSGCYVISNCLSVLVEIDDCGECVRLWRWVES